MADISLNESELRYGISALDLKHRDYAVNDELMVDGRNGGMLYKRLDGQVVVPSLPYGRDDLIMAINRVFDTHKEVVVSDSDYLVYNTIIVNEKMNMLSSKKQDVDGDLTVTSDKLDSCIFVRVRGNSVTNAIASYLSSRAGDIEAASVSCVFKITELGTGAVRQVTVESLFDTLSYCELCENLEPSAGCTGYQIKLETVSFPLLESVYNTLSDTEKSMLSELNYGNEKSEPSEIDLIYYTRDSKNAKIYNETNNLKLNYVIPAGETNRDDFVISETQPNHKCMWAKVIG